MAPIKWCSPARGVFQVCPGAVVYHYVVGGEETADYYSDAGGHRRRLLAGATPTPAADHGTPTAVAVHGSDPGVTYHAKFNIIVHSGDIYYTSRHEHAPIKLIPPYRYPSQPPTPTTADRRSRQPADANARVEHDTGLPHSLVSS